MWGQVQVHLSGRIQVGTGNVDLAYTDWAELDLAREPGMGVARVGSWACRSGTHIGRNTSVLVTFVSLGKIYNAHS